MCPGLIEEFPGFSGSTDYSNCNSIEFNSLRKSSDCLNGPSFAFRNHSTSNGSYLIQWQMKAVAGHENKSNST